MQTVVAMILLAVTLGLPAQAGATAFPQPDKPIRFLIGFPPGSTIDSVARVVLDDIRARTGALLVIENKPGALGLLGVDAVARAAPDGYTMMPSSSATSSSAPHLSKAFQRFDAVKDFTAVARLVRFDVAIVTRAGGPHADARQLIEAARAKPDAVTSGYGSGTGQVVAAAFSRAAGAQVLSVSYKGQPAAVTDLMGGRIDFVASDLGAVLSHVRAGNLNAVALVAGKRSSILPSVPTVDELGLEGMDLSGWIGVSGPAGLAPDALQWWSEQLTTSLNTAAVQERLRTLGMEPDLATGPAFQRFVQAQYDAWGRQIRRAGIAAQ